VNEVRRRVVVGEGEVQQAAAACARALRVGADELGEFHQRCAAVAVPLPVVMHSLGWSTDAGGERSVRAASRFAVRTEPLVKWGGPRELIRSTERYFSDNP
jgi:hypothetical protein